MPAQKQEIKRNSDAEAGTNLDFIAELSLGDFDVIPQISPIVHQGEKFSGIVDVDQLKIFANHVGHVHVMGRGANILQLLACQGKWRRKG